MSSGEDGGGDCTRTFFTIFFGFICTGCSSPSSPSSGSAVLKVVKGGREVDSKGPPKLELGASKPLVEIADAGGGEGSAPVCFRRKGLLDPKGKSVEDMLGGIRKGNSELYPGNDAMSEPWHD